MALSANDKVFQHAGAFRFSLRILCNEIKYEIKYEIIFCMLISATFSKAVANGLVGQILAGSLFLKVKTKFHFTKNK